MAALDGLLTEAKMKLSPLQQLRVDAIIENFLRLGETGERLAYRYLQRAIEHPEMVGYHPLFNGCCDYGFRTVSEQGGRLTVRICPVHHTGYRVRD